MLTPYSQQPHIPIMGFAVDLKISGFAWKSRALDFIMSYSAFSRFSWVNHFFCVLWFPIHEMTFVEHCEVSCFPGRCSPVLSEQQVKFSDIHSWLPVNGMWGLKTSTAGEYHTQLFTHSCGVLLKPVTRSLYQVWCSILSTPTNKDLQPKQFHLEEEKKIKKRNKKKEGSICSQSFSLSKCQTSQHVRHVSQVLSVSLGHTSSSVSEKWKFDCEGPCSICCSWWPIGREKLVLK